MRFSLAIFSADWPIVSPVDGSAIAGDTGIKSRGRIFAKAFTRSTAVVALLASATMSARRRARPSARCPPCRTACDIRRPRRRAVRFHPALHSPFAPGGKLASALRGGELAAETPFSQRTRARALASMAAEPVDVFVIGGGI